MVGKNIFFIFVVFAIIVMGLTIYPVLADEPATEIKSVTIDKKAAAIEKYKAELAAKAAKKKAENEVNISETAIETVETTIDTKVVEIKDETTEEVIDNRNS